MTKQHFEYAAQYVRGLRYGNDGTAEDRARIATVEQAFAALFARFNGRFDRTRFLHACRGEDAHDSAGRRVRYSNGSE